MLIAIYCVQGNAPVLMARAGEEVAGGPYNTTTESLGLWGLMLFGSNRRCYGVLFRAPLCQILGVKLIKEIGFLVFF